MDKIFTLKLKQEEVDILSEVVSEFLSCIEDRCDGAFTVGYKSDKKLGYLSLFVVTDDHELIETINGKTICSDVCSVNVIGVLTSDFFEQKGMYRVDKMLKSGKIVYDKDGSLRIIKKNLESDKNVGFIKSRNAVNVKPPLQYVKK